jgi:endonuclease III
MNAATMAYLIGEQNISIDVINNTDEKELNKWISRVNFHNKKAFYIKQAAKIIAEKFNGIVPSK